MEEEDKSIYEDEVREELEESDQISPEEEGFMLGYSKKKDEEKDNDKDDDEEPKDEEPPEDEEPEDDYD